MTESGCSAFGPADHGPGDASSLRAVADIDAARRLMERLEVSVDASEDGLASGLGRGPRGQAHGSRGAVHLPAPVQDREAPSGAGAAGCAYIPSLPSYAIDGLIGEGASSRVYAAVHVPTGRRVAIKILRHPLGPGRATQRAWRELDLLSDLRLSCLPQVLDYGEAGGCLFLVMEEVRGRSLLAWCAAHARSRRDRVTMLVRVARAVQSLHERGVMHRDLKSDNILVTQHGDPVLIDLGIAAILTGGGLETLSPEGTPIGTPAYMAPEQARGEQCSISTRSDVYALGAIGCEMLTGTPPHDMDVPLHEAIRRVSQDPPRPVRMLAPDLPVPLAAVIDQALSPAPVDRYASAGDFAADLDRWLRGDPVAAVRPSAIQRLARCIARRPRMATAMICLFIAMCVFLGTAVSVRWYNAEPYAVRMDMHQRSFAELLARSGRVLHVWGGDQPFQINHIQWMTPAIGRGARVLVAHGIASDDVQLRGRMAMYDVRRPARPLWVFGGGEPDLILPETPPGAARGNGRFQARTAILVSTIRNAEGQESGPRIISAHRLEHFSLTAICVHDVEGHLRWVRWHHGMIEDLYWLSETQTLIVHAHLNWSRWADRGVDTASGPYPLALMGVSLAGKDGGRCDVPNSAARWDEAQLKPEWIRVLAPPQHQRPFMRNLSLGRPPTHLCSGTYFQVRYREPGVREFPASIRWHFNDRGEIESVVADDFYSRDATLPNSDELSWMELEDALRKYADP